MDFKSGKKSISGLFSCKKQFVIPRFQREYSWGKLELDEFLNDILSRIKINESGKLDTAEYFWGSLLLVGDLDDQKELCVNVVDGQQRITTMTIFLSVIAKYFSIKKEKGLADALWEFIIGKDANTQEYAILKNETPKPLFQFIIQKLVEDKIEPKNTEEEKIIKANQFFKSNLSASGLKKRLIRLKKESICEFDYIEILKVVRDQLLRSFVICITTTDEAYANMIFEILNAKGKELASVDLIKNAIFDKLDSEVPADKAKESWLAIRNNLCCRNQRIEFATFYRHFWIAYYGKVQDNKLYSDFQKKIPKSETAYLSFLGEMEVASKLYTIILNPLLNMDFSNKKEYNFLIYDLYAINDVMGIVQIRPVLLALLYLDKYKECLTYKNFKNSVEALTSFHLMYNAICSKRTSNLETPLNNFAFALLHSKNKTDVSEAMSQLKDVLLVLIPSEEEFIDEFITLKFSKDNIPTNVLTKYLVARWQCMVSNSDIPPQDSSIEHICNENKLDEITMNIGNLVLLEQVINSSIPQDAKPSEKLNYYEKSKYESVSRLIQEYIVKDDFDSSTIMTRANKWAKEYYSKLKEMITHLV